MANMVQLKSNVTFARHSRVQVECVLSKLAYLHRRFVFSGSMQPSDKVSNGLVGLRTKHNHKFTMQI